MASKVGEVFAELKLKGKEANRQLGEFIKKTKDAGAGLLKTEMKTKRFSKALKNAGDVAQRAGAKIKKGMGAAVGAIGLATVAAFAFAKSWSASTDELQKFSQEVDITANELQKLEFAAGLQGEKGESVRAAIKQFARLSVDAREKGVTPFSIALNQLGLSFEDLDSKTFTEKLGLVGDRLNLIEDDATRTSLKLRIFGRDGQKIGNTLALGSKGIKAATEEVAALGAELSGKALKAAAEFNDESQRLEVTILGVKNVIAEELVPVITSMITKFRQWILQNRELIATRLKEFLVGAVKVFRELVPLVTKMASAIAGFVESLGGIEPALKAVAGAFVAFQIVALGVFGAAAPWLVGITLAITALSILTSKAKAAREEVDKFANTKVISETETAGGKDISLEKLEKTEQGRTIINLRKQRDVFQRENEQAKKDLESAKRDIANRPIGTGRDVEFAQRTAAKTEAREEFERRVNASALNLTALNRIIDRQTAKFRKDAAASGTATTEPTDDPEKLELIKERQRLAIRFTRGELNAEELKRFRKLSADQKVKIPKKIDDPFADKGDAGSRAKEDKGKTALELVNALTQGGATAISQLQPTGSGNVTNHFNNTLNFTADIDINLAAGRDIPRDGSMREVTEMLKATSEETVRDVVDQAFQLQKRQVVG